MRAAYVTTYDSSDVHAWSGLGSRIRLALEAAGLDIVPIGNLGHKYGSYFKAKRAIYGKFSSCKYDPDREPLLLRHYARQVERALEHVEHDVVISPGTLPIALLRTTKPIVTWTDATFDALVDFYPHFTNLCTESRRHGHAMEQEALSRCSLALYSSEWAAQSAVRFYRVNPAKVHVVPFGANTASGRSAAEIEQLTARKRFDRLQLLFVGADWERKRGDLAIAIAARLNESGTPTELHVVGSAPHAPPPPFVTLHGYVSSNTAQGRREIDDLMSTSHFLVLPSRAECCAVVLAEASSYGLPALTTRVGGNQTAITDGVNGQTFELSGDAAAYAGYIHRTIVSPGTYSALALAAHREYSDRLNWSAAGARAFELIRTTCS